MPTPTRPPLLPVTPADVSVFPDFGALGGEDLIYDILGALLTFVLVFSLLMLLVSAIVWAVGASTGSMPLAARGRTGVLVSLGGAALGGAGVSLLNFLVDIGSTI